MAGTRAGLIGSRICNRPPQHFRVRPDSGVRPGPRQGGPEARIGTVGSGPDKQAVILREAVVRSAKSAGDHCGVSQHTGAVSGSTRHSSLALRRKP